MNYDAHYTNLSTWLRAPKPDYNTGLALLLSYADKPALHAQLSQYRDAKKLRQVIQSMFDKVKGKMPTQPPSPLKGEHEAYVQEPKKYKPPTQPTGEPQPTAAPRGKVEQELHKEWVDLLKQIEDLKQKLYFIGRDAGTGKAKQTLTKDEKEQRREISRLLVGKGGLNEQCMKNRDALRYFGEFGKLPERERITVKPEERVVEGDLYLLKENARKQASKLRTKIKNANAEFTLAKGKEQQKIQKDIAQWTEKLQKEEEDLKYYQSKMNGGK